MFVKNACRWHWLPTIVGGEFGASLFRGQLSGKQSA
jgi:hypothetical protein